MDIIDTRPMGRLLRNRETKFGFINCIIKYLQWSDSQHEYGFTVNAPSTMFSLVWFRFADGGAEYQQCISSLPHLEIFYLQRFTFAYALLHIDWIIQSFDSKHTKCQLLQFSELQRCYFSIIHWKTPFEWWQNALNNKKIYIQNYL